MDVNSTVSYSMVPSQLKSLFRFDHARLRKRLQLAPVVHITPDLTQIGGEERLELIAAFTEWVKDFEQIARRLMEHRHRHPPLLPEQVVLTRVVVPCP